MWNENTNVQFWICLLDLFVFCSKVLFLLLFKMWEAALKICKELVQRYEEVTMEYNKLSKLLSDMSKFYENIMDPQVIRPEPEYFRVAYYGRGFPAFLQNKVLNLTILATVICK